ncbi:MAG: pseudouridine synthase [Planctomycetota bacterium]
MDGMKPGHVPLERALSKLGLASRSQARKLIVDGKVRVNGTIRLDTYFAVVPEKVRIDIDGMDGSRVTPRTLMLYKPRGCVTTSSDEKGRSTVFSLIPDMDSHMVAVGRLDWATSGLLIITNDTRLASNLSDPKNRIPRTYLVSVRGLVTEAELDIVRRGVRDEGEYLTAESIVLRKASGKESHLVVTLLEGKNREIRRIFDAIKHEVTKLKRVGYGGLTLGDLEPGQHRDLVDDEIRLIFENAVPE